MLPHSHHTRFNIYAEVMFLMFFKNINNNYLGEIFSKKKYYKIRTKWDPEIEDYYYSVIDVIAVLTESKNPRRYQSDLKRKLKKEGSQLYENIVQLKMKSNDNKFYKTDAANTEQLLRLIQSVSSPKTEPFIQ